MCFWVESTRSDCPRLTLVVAPMGKLGTRKNFGRRKKKHELFYHYFITTDFHICEAGEIIRNETHVFTLFPWRKSSSSFIFFFFFYLPLSRTHEKEEEEEVVEALSGIDPELERAQPTECCCGSPLFVCVWVLNWNSSDDVERKTWPTRIQWMWNTVRYRLHAPQLIIILHTLLNNNNIRYSSSSS